MSDYMDQEMMDAYDARFEREDWADWEEREGCFEDDGPYDDDGEEHLL